MGFLIGLVVVVLWILAIVNIVQSKAEAAKKILWLVLVILLPLLGSILYFIIGKKQLN